MAFLGPLRLAGSLAKRQQAIDQQIVKVDDAWKATGHDFRRDCFESWKESQTAAGCLMFAIAYHTALTLYRSPFMGKQTELGQTTLKNLKNVLTSMNTHEWCRRTEHAMTIPALKEMREFTKKPLSSFNDLPEEEALPCDRSASGLAASGPAPPHAPAAEPVEDDVAGVDDETARFLDELIGPDTPEVGSPMAQGAVETLLVQADASAVPVAAGLQEAAPESAEPAADTPTQESKEPEPAGAEPEAPTMKQQPAGTEPAAEAPPQKDSQGAASGHAAKKPKTDSNVGAAAPTEQPEDTKTPKKRPRERAPKGAQEAEAPTTKSKRTQKKKDPETKGSPFAKYGAVVQPFAHAAAVDVE